MGLTGYIYDSVKDSLLDFELDLEYRSTIMQIGRLTALKEEDFNEVKSNYQKDHPGTATEEKKLEQRVQSMFGAFSVPKEPKEPKETKPKGK